MRLNPPSLLIFWMSIILALLAVATKLGYFGIPRYLVHQEYWLAIVAYFTLMIGNIVRGL
jgi:small-conductance mechanosensitive channel